MQAGEVTVVVLCGGTSRRLGGGDKTREPLADSTVLDHLLAALPDWPVVCVGASRPTVRAVTWTREDPPGGGPLAGIAAALPLVEGEIVVVVAGDMPFAGSAVRGLAAAVRAAPVVDAALAVGPDGRLQPLLAAYRADAVRRVLPEDPHGAPAMLLAKALRVLPVDVTERVAFDVDTAEELARARHTLDP